ncbi:hypothetical protein [Actinocorallia herbida]|uniref:hypothetical protein n=1 Tax=Actinocorallia herbida TaxID=58109 RepID=UPI0011CD795D|nr:hypothetical protein [Actinocorallia herbida]
MTPPLASRPARRLGTGIGGQADANAVDVFATILEEPGNVSVKTIEREVTKLTAIRKVGLSDDPFADVAPKVPARCSALR